MDCRQLITETDVTHRKKSDLLIRSLATCGLQNFVASCDQFFFHALKAFICFLEYFVLSLESVRLTFFAIVKRRSSNKDPSTGQPCRYDLVCDQGKASKPSQAAGTREAYSRKHGCPWKAAVAAFHTEVLSRGNSRYAKDTWPYLNDRQGQSFQDKRHLPFLYFRDTIQYLHNHN